MSALTDQIAADAAKIHTDASLLHQITHGSNTTTVTTEGGNVKSAAKVIKDMDDSIAAQVTSLASAVSSSAASASTATTQAAAAAASATTATTQASAASSSATGATASASSATTSASTATTQAGIATTQAGLATTAKNTAEDFRDETEQFRDEAAASAAEAAAIAGIDGVATALQAKQGQDSTKVITPSTLSSATGIPIYAISRFRSKLASLTLGTANTQLKILIWGDSVANLQMAYVNLALARAYGDLGTGASPTLNASSGDVIVNDGGAVPYNYNFHWTGSYFDVGVSGSPGTITFGRGGGAVRTDSIHCYYIKEPGAGTFKVQTSANGGAYSDEVGYTNVDAAIGSGIELGIIELPKTVGNFNVRIIGLTGRVKHWFPYFENSTDNGVIQVHAERGGLGLGDAHTMSSVLFDAWIQDIAPDIAFFQMKEGANYATDLANHISRFNTAYPSMNWVYFLSTPESSDGPTGISWQNQQTRTQAIANGNAVIDLFSPCISFANMLAIGWGTGTDVHPLTPCNRALADYVIAPALGIAAGKSETLSMPLRNESVKTRRIDLSNSYATSSDIDLTPAGSIVASGDLDLAISAIRQLSLSSGSGSLALSGGTTMTFTAAASNAAITFSTPAGYIQFNNTISLAAALNQSHAGTCATFGNSANNNIIQVVRSTTNPSTIQLRAFSNAPDINFVGSDLGIAYNGTKVAAFSQTGGLTTGAPNGGTAAAVKFGVAASVSPTAPNRTIEIDVAGTRYFVHAKTTND